MGIKFKPCFHRLYSPRYPQHIFCHRLFIYLLIKPRKANSEAWLIGFVGSVYKSYKLSYNHNIEWLFDNYPQKDRL
jgi:hypothetical protein